MPPNAIVTKDPQIDAIYISVNQGVVHRTQEVASEPMVNIDWAADGTLLGIELIGLQAAIEHRWGGPVRVHGAVALPDGMGQD